MRIEITTCYCHCYCFHSQGGRSFLLSLFFLPLVIFNHRIQGNGLCDKRKRLCKKTTVQGRDFLNSANMTCHIREIEVQLHLSFVVFESSKHSSFPSQVYEEEIEFAVSRLSIVPKQTSPSRREMGWSIVLNFAPHPEQKERLLPWLSSTRGIIPSTHHALAFLRSSPVFLSSVYVLKI